MKINKGSILFIISLSLSVIVLVLSPYAANGDIIWTFTPVGSNTSYPAIGEDGTVYVGAGSLEYFVYAINPDGTQKWVSPSMPGTTSYFGDLPKPATVASSCPKTWSIKHPSPTWKSFALSGKYCWM